MTASAGHVNVLDAYYLSITLLVTIGYQLSFFAVAWTFKFDKVTDFAGGTNFFWLALMTLLLGGINRANDARNIVASVLVMVWALRLSGFLLFRILKSGSDTRFDDKRNNFFKFLGFWVFQMFWVWTVSMPLTILNSPKIMATGSVGFGTARDIVGIVFFAIGFFVEAIADQSKYMFKKKHPKAFCNVGVWAWSRHPNYFGEIFLWWGIWMLCLSPSTNGPVRGSGYAAQYASIVGPVFITLLLFGVSGLPLQEEPTQKKMYKSDKRDAYATYLNSTSIVVPFPPPLYRPLPTFIKRSVLLDFPFYQYDPSKDQDAQDDEQERGSSHQGTRQSTENLHNGSDE
ncbi:protein of unknown function [Taphrina deformans PYCC 5710]|uniref:Steroid 5-alpha reductase C-terminal domain-containing protein n=1 Tax=Taphrina deformans (strain PYCC 5710 / ATCC 11124 / CBS 356.35 / IMI 108563 / JCM 9778 / NBRC 8474) TaxID=1097556 RepID=R4XL00_TAPDE|nr:protein of unknown function [Taphrina deformans PYCC 5710]|eukprot:CCG83994.1 protein of unknown function [Taphrina deformans PYCC 5710]